MRDKEGALVLTFGEQQIPLVYENKGYTVNGVGIAVEAIRANDPEQTLKGVKFVLSMKIEIDDIDETAEFTIPIRLVPESDYKKVIKSLKAGDLPEEIKQMGTGFRLSLKPFMLPIGSYKLLNYKEFIYKQPGKTDAYIYSGDCRNVETGELHTIELSTNPFKGNRQFMDVCSGKTPNKGIYFMVAGAYDIGEGKTSALINALQLKEVDGQVTPALWAKFIENSNAEIATQRQRNQGKILKPEDIQAKREAMEQKQLAKMAAKKTDAANTAVPLERNTAATPADFDEIPF
jgi:hypothetical protein